MDSERRRRRTPPPPEAPPAVPSADRPATEGSPSATPVWAAGKDTAAKETEADALAAAALHAERPTGQRRGLQPPAAPADAEAGAVPLPPRIRSEFEARFGYDLSAVRLQPDDPGVRDLGSDAIALGRLVSFAPGRWDPDGAGGRELLAHELAHVILARSEPAAMASQKSSPAPQSFYQDVSDAYQASWGPEELAIKPLLVLCRTVEAGVAKDVGANLDELEKTDAYLLPLLFPRSSTANELMARMALLGLPDQLSRYLRWHVNAPGNRTLRTGTTTNRRYYDDEVWHWEQVLDILREKVAWHDATTSLEVLDALTGLIPHFKKDLDHIEKDQRKELEADELRLRDAPVGGFGMQVGNHISIARYRRRLLEFMTDAFVNAQAPVQALMDLATDDLRLGRGTATLDALAKRLEIMPRRDDPGAAVEINETEFVRKGRKDVLLELDYFKDQPGAKKRNVQLETYDAEAEGLYTRPSQMVEPKRIIAIRQSQVALLRRLYGVDTSGGTKTLEAQENAAALGSLGKEGLRLHNDDDWRAFLLAKYRAKAATASPAQSFDEVVRFLRDYLRAFTTHSPFNIDDFGDNLLTKTFPRALTGQLVHDCGVYALRIAYLLSRIREEPSLKLEIRFIQLPVHIGLVITSKVAPIGVYLVHNDAVTQHAAQDVADVRKTWDVTDERGEPRPAAAHTAKADDQFYGELAAHEFVPLTDAPFIVSDVPRSSGDPARDKAALWRAYRSGLRRKLFGKPSEDPKDPDYQFHLRYLNLLELIKQHHNSLLVPFWNTVAHPAWTANAGELAKADTRRNTASGVDEKKAAETAFAAVRDRYLRAVEPGLEEVRTGYGKVSTASAQLTTDLQARPELVAPGASRASSDRLAEVSDYFLQPWWARESDEHIRLMKRGLLDEPPFAKPTDLLAPAD